MIELLGMVDWGLLAGLEAITPVYIVCMIVGGGLLLVSTVLGGHADGADFHVDAGVDTDVDFHVDMDVDPGVDVDVSGSHDFEFDAQHELFDGHDSVFALSNWFSIRFLIYFVATFGLIGTVLTYMTDTGAAIVLVVSVVGGLIAGQGVHQVLRILRENSGNSVTRVEDYINVSGRVTVSINPPACGEVSVSVGGTERYVPAFAKRKDDKFSIGDQVTVVGFSNGVAEVVSREEYEFINKS